MASRASVSTDVHKGHGNKSQRLYRASLVSQDKDTPGGVVPERTEVSEPK